jgi:hypothetical protein
VMDKKWISVKDETPNAGEWYWHTHIKQDGTFTPVYRGVYNWTFKKMMAGKDDFSFTHFMESKTPAPPELLEAE